MFPQCVVESGSCPSLHLADLAAMYTMNIVYRKFLSVQPRLLSYSYEIFTIPSNPNARYLCQQLIVGFR